ncbi:MAG TPA: hypothetical protein VFZ65_10545 [Planctomycetota bacterium]|nr:hypothetical protein [Planctomycetota bacterium]
MNIRALLCLLSAVGVEIPAQTVHVVSPGGPLPEITSALAIATPGDIIHVLPGTYTPFSVTIGCTIRALSPGVHVTASMGPNPVNPVTISPPTGQVVHLDGLAFAFGTNLPGDGVLITGGRVTLDECSFYSSYDTPLVISNADVHMQGCTAVPPTFGFHAMRGNNARITAIDSTFSDGGGFVFHYFPSTAIDLISTTLHAAGCTIRAAIGPGNPPVAALQAAGGNVWLSDCTVVGILTCPIVATSVLVDRCVLQPTLPSCPTPASGGLLGVSRSQPLQNGAPFSLVYRTIPNGYAAVFASQELASLTIPGLHAQTQWLGPGVINLGVVLADSSGDATATWMIPAGAWLVDQPLWFQGLTGFALPLQLSPVAGGLIR